MSYVRRAPFARALRTVLAVGTAVAALTAVAPETRAQLSPVIDTSGTGVTVDLSVLEDNGIGTRPPTAMYTPRGEGGAGLMMPTRKMPHSQLHVPAVKAKPAPRLRTPVIIPPAEKTATPKAAPVAAPPAPKMAAPKPAVAPVKTAEPAPPPPAAAPKPIVKAAAPKTAAPKPPAKTVAAPPPPKVQAAPKPPKVPAPVVAKAPPPPAVTAPPAPKPVKAAPKPPPAPKPAPKPAPTVEAKAEAKVAAPPAPKPAPKPAPAPAPVAEPAPPPPVAAPTTTAKAAPPPPPAPAAKPKTQVTVPLPSAPTAQPQTASRTPAAVPASTDSHRIAFNAGDAKLPDDAKPGLADLAKRMAGEKSLRLQLKAYAGGDDLSSSKARRLSLSRALSVRSYLIEQGVRSTRIDVRALGNKTSEEPVNRVDLTVVER